jgi:hypothetical protein
MQVTTVTRARADPAIIMGMAQYGIKIAEAVAFVEFDELAITKH